ncbi:MAG: lipopolysaccharide heptosyltransferase II [candidate division Zixibacteria bacterium]|nr:lipopolysaccharide heptosyltransferase II [candidate division Zixibacteria bacterium]
MVKTVVIQTAFLGDLLLTLPLIKALKLQDPEGEIHVLARGGCGEVLQSNPEVDAVMEYDKSGNGTGLNMGASIAELRYRHFDRAVIPHKSLRSALIALLAEIPERVGFFSTLGYLMYSNSVEFPPTGHQVIRYLTLAGERGADVDRYPIVVYPSDDNYQKADNLISEIMGGKAENIAAIAPGSVWATKRWLPEYYADLASRLIKDFDYHVILTGSRDDRDLCYDIGKLLPSSGWAITAGDFSIMDTAAIYARSSFVVANDSAAGHLASAVSTPVLTIYGPTVPAFGFYPVGKQNIIVEKKDLYCRPCSKHGPRECPEGHFRCMRELTTNTVLEHIDELLENI